MKKTTSTVKPRTPTRRPAKRQPVQSAAWRTFVQREVWGLALVALGLVAAGLVVLDLVVTEDLEAEGWAVTRTLGRHTNDQMISFYLTTPSGFHIEYGYGGLQGDVSWVPKT